MNFTLTCEDENRTVTIHHHELDYLPDVLDMLLNFMQAIGYTYVNKLGAIQSGGKETWTE